MSTRLFTSDLHLRHAKVAQIRGFESIEAHDTAVVASWREHVRKQDVVWVLGDLTVGSADDEAYALELVASLPGTKHFVSGNHDSAHPRNSSSRNRERMLRWLEVFESVSPIASLKMAGREVMLSHFPYDGPGGDHTDVNRHVAWRAADTGRWLLHGHTHLDHQRHHHGRQIHVGFDAWRRPVAESEIIALMTGADEAETV